MAELKITCPNCFNEEKCFEDVQEQDGKSFSSYMCFNCGYTSNTAYKWDSPELKKHYELIWKLDKKILQHLKCAKPGKETCSGIYDDVWSLYFRPNGRLDDPGECHVGLRFDAMPEGVHSIKTKRQLEIIENKEIKMEEEFDFNHHDQSRKFKTLSFEEFQKFEELTIKMTIDILNIFDENDNHITSSYFDAQDHREDGKDSPQTAKCHSIVSHSWSSKLLFVHFKGRSKRIIGDR